MFPAGVLACAGGGVPQTVREEIMAANAKSKAAATVRVGFIDLPFVSDDCSAVYKRVWGTLLHEIVRIDLTARYLDGRPL
jgi:hypothetical protein